MKKTCFLLLLCLWGIPASAKRQPHYQHHSRQRTIALDPHRNVLTANPGVGAVGEFAYTIGAGYERFVDKNGKLSFMLSTAFYKGGTVDVSEFDEGSRRARLGGFYVAPGIRFHPIGNMRKADPAFGLCLALGSEYRTDRYVGSGYKVTELHDQKMMSALLGQFSVNFHSDKHVAVFGLSLTGGYLFSNTPQFFNSVHAVENVYAQFGLHVGGRW